MPAFGSPTSPMSAMSRSSRRIQRSAPGSPFWACFGAWWVDVLKWVLPRPPRPPRATIAFCPTATRSATSSPVSSSVDGRAGRDVERQVVAGLTVAPGARAAAAGRRPEVMAVLEVAQRRLAGVDAQIDRAAATAIAAIGSSARDVGFLPEGRGPVAAITGADPDLHAVEEHPGHCPTGSTRRSANRESWRRTVPAKARPSTGASAPKVRERGAQAATHARAVPRRADWADGLEVGERVDPPAAVPDGADPDLEVEVRTGRVAGLADPPDLLASADMLAASRPMIADMWL